MPLKDHFCPPLSDEIDWESFHSAWANTMVRRLNEDMLPDGYRSQPEVRMNVRVEIDVATFEKASVGSEKEASGNGIATEVWAPPLATRTFDVMVPVEDVFEVQVIDRRTGRRVVAAVELVSPRNKDWPDARRAFAIKCASYFQAQVSVVVVDIVTDRHHDLYAEILKLLGQETANVWAGSPPLYAVALRSREKEERWGVETWEQVLTIGQPVRTMPMWLTSEFALPLDLEASYEETCRVLRIS